jgi:hypothetical protein
MTDRTDHHEHTHRAEPPDYTAEIDAYRAAKDDFFRTSHTSTH